MLKCRAFLMILLTTLLIASMALADQGTVTLITSPGAPRWGYRVTWVSGNLDTVKFYPLCDGATGSVSGAAATAGWTVINNGGVLGIPDDIVMFVRPNPLTSGSEDTLWVTHAFCDVYSYYSADSKTGMVEGPAAADYDDLPTPYQTLIAQNGPRHFETSYEWLGACVTKEERPNMLCQDSCEWGVNIPMNIQPCPTVSWMEVLVRTSGLGQARYRNNPDSLLYFHAWIDWTHDWVSGEGDFADSAYCPAWNQYAYEHIHWLNSSPYAPMVINGSASWWVNGAELSIMPRTAVVTLLVPFLAGPNTPYGITYARYRLGYGPDRYRVAQPTGKAMFGEVEGSCCETQLPVELVSFTGVGEDNKVLLNWSTASELNNDHFVVRRASSPEGPFTDWATIPGSGTTETQHSYSYTDAQVINGVTYYYRLRDIDINGQIQEHDITVTVKPTSSSQGIFVTEYYLHQNYPNPFNPVTSISYDIVEPGMVSLKVYNAEGREVATLVNEYQTQNRYAVSFDVTNLSSGIYFYRLETNGFMATKKMVVLK
jgi:hypothetical protein